MKITLLAALALAASVASAQGPSPTPVAPRIEGYTISAKLGGSVSMSSNSDALLTPIAILSSSGPLALGNVSVEKLPVLHVEMGLSALPGDTIDQAAGISNTLAQFKALDFSLGLSRRVSRWLDVGNQSVATSVYAEAGFATRLAGEVQPRDKTARYACGGLRFDERNSSSYLKTGLCADGRLDGTYQPVLAVNGTISAFSISPNAGVSIFIRALIGLDLSSPTRPGLTGAHRDSIIVGTLLGWQD